MIIIDKIVESNAGAGASTSLTFDIIISSADCVLVVGSGSSGAAVPTVTANGMPLPVVVSNPTNANAYLFCLLNPPVGNVTIVVTYGASTTNGAWAMSLLGVSKRSSNFVTAIANPASTTDTLTITPPQANCMIIDVIVGGTAIAPANANQTQIFNSAGGRVIGSSYLISTSGNPQNMSWSSTAAGATSIVAMVLEPDQAPSMWFPNIRERSQYDIARVSAFDANQNLSGVIQNTPSYPSTFFNNSFLHTIGKLVFPPIVVPTIQASNFSFLGHKAAAATITLPVEVPAGSNLVLIPIAVHDSNEVNHQTTSVTLNGINATKIVEFDETVQTRSEIWGIVSPLAGPQNIVVTFSLLQFVSVGAYSFKGVKAILPTIIGGVTDTTGGHLIASRVQVAKDNSYIIDVISSESSNAPDASQSLQYQDTNASFTWGASSIIFRRLAGSYEMKWPTNGAHVSHSVVVIEAAQNAETGLIPDSIADSSFINYFYRSLGKLINISVGGQNFTQNITDTISSLDTSNNLTGKNLSESSTLIDVSNNQPLKGIVDTISNSDNVAKLPNNNQGDGMTVVELTTKSTTKLFSDSSTFVDSLVRLGQKVILDTITSIDSITTFFQHGKLFTDTMTMVEGRVKIYRNGLLAIGWQIVKKTKDIWTKIIKKAVTQ